METGGSPEPGRERPASIAELWVDPGAIGERDAYIGPGGPEGAPARRRPRSR